MSDTCPHCEALEGFAHAADCPTQKLIDEGVIHEPGTGGDDGEGNMQGRADDQDGTETEITWLARLLREEREANTTLAKDAAVLSMQVFTAQRDLDTAAQQRDFLTGQCASLINRVAGAHVAAGLIDLAGAQGFVLKESLPINHMLQQIAAANAPPQQAEAGGDNPDYVEPQP